MAEREIHRAIAAYLRSGGAYVVKTAPPMENGTPDLLACLNGRFFGIEVKQPGKSPSKIQQHRMRQIQQAGGFAFTATSVDDVREQFEKINRQLRRAAKG